MSFSGLLSELNDLILTINVAIAIGSILLILISFKLYLRISRHFKRKSYPPDIVILHQFPRAKRVPSLSPFALKLETWLRMNDIKYQNEFGYSYGPKGKIPYITYNGQDIADSQFCIEFLSKTFKKNLNEDHASKDLGAARAFLKMMEESFLWVSALSRFCYEPNPECTGLPSIVLWYMSHKLKRASNVQGYGRHSKDELFSIGKDDLKSLNDFLAGKKYLIGDKPCNEDASVFGQVAQIIYTNNGILNKFIKDECPNILNYTENIKKTFWPDWAECIKDKKERLIN